jgi:hypothetical protein
MDKKGRKDINRQCRYIGPTLNLVTNGIIIGDETAEEG